MGKTRIGDLVSDNLLSTDIGNDRVGIGSTLPSSKLDVGGDVKVSGVITATSFSGDGSGLTGVANTANIVSDTIDSGSLDVTGIGTIGNIEIDNTTIENTNFGGTLILAAKANMQLRVNSSSSNLAMVANSGGSVDLYHNNTKKFETTGFGVTVTGIASATSYYGDGSTLSGLVTSITAGSNISVDSSTGSVTITGLANTANIVSDTIDSGSLNVTGVSTFSDDVSIAEDKKIIFGDEDLYIYHTGGTAFIDNNVGQIRFKSLSSMLFYSESGLTGGVVKEYAKFLSNAAVELYYNGVKKFETASNGVNILSTDTGSSAGPELTLYRNSSSPAPGDYLGQIMFKGENSNGGEENYAKITGKISDETLGTEDGLIETAIKGDGSFTIVSRQRSDELQLINGVGLSVDGDSTFTGGIDVDGHTELDNVNVSGVVTTSKLHVDPVGSGITYNEDLVVLGNARVTGILSIGTSSIVLDANAKTIRGINEIRIDSDEDDDTPVIIRQRKGRTFFRKTRKNHANKVVEVEEEASVGIGTTVSVNTSGIITATSFFGTSANFSGNVSIGGTLTYEDVTNVDSVGLITARSGVDVTGNITVTGTVDGRDIASDGSKLDGIESGATADQTAAEILTLIKTVDGSGSGLDADTLDNLGSGAFLRSNAADTATGDITFRNNKLIFDNTTFSTFDWQNYQADGGDLTWTVGGTSGPEMELESDGSNYLNTELRVGGSKVWHAGNDGSGSGLDADTLDGVNSGSFLRSDANDTTSATYTFTSTSTTVNLDFSGHAGASSYNYFMRAQNDGGVKAVHFVNGSTRSGDGGANAYTIRNDGGSLILGRSSQSTILYGSGDLTYNSNEVWHAGNDGSGSGLDADTVDGLQASSFLRSDTASEITAPLTIDSDNNQNGALRIENIVSDTNNDFYFAQEISQTLSGSQVATADREQGGIFMDINSTNTGGDTSNEHRAYGIFIDLDSTGDADAVYGIHVNNTATPTTGTTSNVWGGYFFTEDNGGAGAVSNVYGVQAFAYSDNADSDTNNQYGGYFKSYCATDSAAVGAGYGVYAEIEINGTTDLYGPCYALRAEIDNNTNVEQTNTSYLLYGNYSGTLPTTAYGVYINNNVPSYFGGGIEIPNGPGTIAGGTFANGWLRIGTSSLGWAFDSNELITFGTCIFGSASGSTLSFTNRPAFNGGTSGSSSPFTVDSTQVVTNLNADLLDGVQAWSFLRSDADDYKTGGFLRFNDNLNLQMGTDNDIAFFYNGSDFYMDFNTAGDSWYIRDSGDNAVFGFSGSGNLSLYKGDLNVGDGGDNSRILIKKADNNVADHIQFYNGTTRIGEIGCQDDTWLRINQVTNKNIYTPRYIRADAGLFVDGVGYGINGSGTLVSNTGATIAGNTVWHAGNDGSGSGLDADTVDGIQGANIVKANAGANLYTDFNSYTANGVYKLDNIQGSGTNNRPTGAYGWGALRVTQYANSSYIIQEWIPHQYEVWTRMLWNGSWTAWREQWTSASDGSGSGLDADTIDGTQLSNLMTLSGNQTITGDKDFDGTLTYDVMNGPNNSSRYKIRVYSSGDYAIGMQSGITFGGLNDWGMTFQFNNEDDRGFWWGDGAHTTAQGAMALTTNGKLTVAHSMRLGYGESDTTIPGATHRLDVNGSSYFTNGDGAGAIFTSSAYSSDFLYIGGWSGTNSNNIHRIRTSTNLHIDSSSDSGLYFQWYSGGEIRSNGALRFQDNKTLRLGSGADYQMWHDGNNTVFRNYHHASGNVYHQGENTSGTNQNGIIEFYNTTRSYIILYENSAEKLRTTSGGVTITGALTATGDVTAFSDITLKEDVEVIPNALDKVSQISGVTFTRKDLEDKSRKSGVIAQEVEKVLPEVVTTNEDGIKTVAYGNLVGLLIESIKELKAEVEILKAERN